MTTRCCAFCFILFLAFNTSAFAVTLTSGQTDYTTNADITTSASGIITSLSGTSGNLNKIKNLHIITTGASGTTSSAYGIRSSGDYYQITNDTSGQIITTGNSGRGISLSDFSTVINSGSIQTQGTTSYGIYAGGNSSNISNSGSITTTNTTSYGIYLSGNNNSATNSGTISAKVYGIYGDGDANHINNLGIITTTNGSSAHGIFVSAGSASSASASNYSTINNSGNISANANGIYNRDNYSEITNSGNIISGSGNSNYGIRSDGNNSVITNSGTIFSTTYAIYNAGSNSVINNSGTLNGGVLIGSATFNISGGSISGVVEGSSSGTVNINSNFTQSAAFNNLTSLNISAGHNLISNATISAGSINLASSASLTLASNSAINAPIQGGGTLNISGSNFSTSNAIGISGNALANLTIYSASSLTSTSDIYADNIALSGALNLDTSDNLTIFGNLTGSGSGTINLGNNNQTISGNLTLLSNDTLATSLGNNGAGSISVSGIANIDSNTNLTITPTSNQGYISDGTEFTLISGNSSSTINAISNNNISVNGNSSNIYGLLKFTTQSSGDSLVLTVNRLAAMDVTSNKNSQNIYTSLNQIGNGSSGKLSEFQGYLDSSGFTGKALSQAINQAAPISTKANLSVTNNMVNNSIIALESRLDKIKRNSNNGIWVESFGSSATQNAVLDDDAFKANSVGVVIGSDHELGSDSTAGVALSFSRSKVKSPDDLKQNLISSNQLSFYGRQNFDRYFFDNLIGFAWNSFSSNRSITALHTTATARYSGQTYLTKLKVGRIYKISTEISFVPEISLNFLRNNIASYSEKGADEMNLQVGKVAANFLESRIGVNLGWSGKWREFPTFKKMSAITKLSYGHAFINDTPTTTVNFQGQNQSFNQQISQLDNNSFRLGFELAAYHENFTTFNLDYSLEKRATYQSHLIAIRVRQEF